MYVRKKQLHYRHYTLELNMFSVCVLDGTLHHVMNQEMRYVYNIFYFNTYYF